MSDLVKALLGELETELKQQHLWASAPPDAAALASSLPFCYDTLPLENWLQFIFLPRMQALVEGRLPLPNNCGIYPMAELAWAPLTTTHQPLLDALKTLDTLLNDTVPAAGRH